VWTKPGYKALPALPEAPPQTDGDRLATLPRGPHAEMRVSLQDFKGRWLVSFREWERGRDRTWRPVKGKGCTIRVGEIAALVEGLKRAERDAAALPCPPYQRPPVGRAAAYGGSGRPGTPTNQSKGREADVRPEAPPGAQAVERSLTAPWEGVPDW